MKLLIVLITFNRLEYTKRTLRDLWNTLQVPYYLVVVDNNSSDGTQAYLNSILKRNRIDSLILNKENYYPGKAANMGWADGLMDYPQATHLARVDNDMHFEDGWDLRAEECFETIDRLGQLGLDFDGSEDKPPTYYNGMGIIEWPGCVGGPNVIRREIWDDGHRYDESRWENSNSKVQEDSLFSRELKNDGWLVGHMDERLSWTFANKDNWADFPEYYEKTMRDRGYHENVEYIRRLKNGS